MNNLMVISLLYKDPFPALTSTHTLGQVKLTTLISFDSTTLKHFCFMKQQI